jgi:hypothetical protein
MKISHCPKNNDRAGSILVAAMTICIVIGTILGSALLLLQSRYKINIRATAWNTAIPVAEAGVEEAMTHIQDDTSSNPGANSWAGTNIAGQSIYWKRRSFSDGSYFYATIYNITSNAPTIYSSGFVPAPFTTSTYITRTIRVLCTNPANVFTKAIATTGTITMSGGAYVDGFDSRNGAYNASGTNRNSTGSIATDSTANPAIKISTAKVYGTVTTGPGGVLSLSGGAIGDISWATNNTGVEGPSYTNNNFNVSFPSNNTPTAASWLTPSNVTTGGSNITLLNSGSYQLSSFTSSSSSGPMVVAGQATLYVPGDFTVSGSGFVQINPGAALTLIVGGSKTTISGGGVVNQGGYATNFNYVGLSGNTSLTYSGSAEFVGTVNAPQASFTESGGSGAVGAAIVHDATLSGSAGWHYDDSLGSSGGLVATGWSEL